MFGLDEESEFSGEASWGCWALRVDYLTNFEGSSASDLALALGVRNNCNNCYI